MKTIYTLLSLFALSASSGLLASEIEAQEAAKKKVETAEKKMAQATEKKETKKPKEVLKSMLHDAFIIEKSKNKYVGWFLSTKDGKLLVEKIEIQLKDKTPNEVKAHSEIKKELQDKFKAYLDKKGIEIKQK